MAEKAHEKYRITPTAPGGSIEGKSRLILFLHTVLSLLPFGPQTAPMGVRITTADGELVREIRPSSRPDRGFRLQARRGLMGDHERRGVRGSLAPRPRVVVPR